MRMFWEVVSVSGGVYVVLVSSFVLDAFGGWFSFRSFDDDLLWASCSVWFCLRCPFLPSVVLLFLLLIVIRVSASLVILVLRMSVFKCYVCMSASWFGALVRFNCTIATHYTFTLTWTPTVDSVEEGSGRYRGCSLTPSLFLFAVRDYFSHH